MEVMQNLKKRGQIHFQPPSPALLNKIMEKFGILEEIQYGKILA